MLFSFLLRTLERWIAVLVCKKASVSWFGMSPQWITKDCCLFHQEWQVIWGRDLPHPLVDVLVHLCITYFLLSSTFWLIPAHYGCIYCWHNSKLIHVCKIMWGSDSFFIIYFCAAVLFRATSEHSLSMITPMNEKNECTRSWYHYHSFTQGWSIMNGFNQTRDDYYLWCMCSFLLLSIHALLSF